MKRYYEVNGVVEGWSFRETFSQIIDREIDEKKIPEMSDTEFKRAGKIALAALKEAQMLYRTTGR